jgi:hypothetical protein
MIPVHLLSGNRTKRARRPRMPGNTALFRYANCHTDTYVHAGGSGCGVPEAGQKQSKRAIGRRPLVDCKEMDVGGHAPLNLRFGRPFS